MATTLRIVHTSDWHLGCLLYGAKRYEECAAFLDWFAAWLEEHAIDVVLIAGDIFDTMTPSNRAQELYYRFLCTLAHGRVRHVVLTAGNHDSPSFLQAPKDLLRVLNIHVIGLAGDAADDEICVLRDPSGAAELIVCAVPYLRDRDIRLSDAGESGATKELKWQEGVFAHYSRVIERAKELRGDADIPLVVMGHLFTVGGKTVEGDGVRDLAVGSLSHVAPSCFSDGYSYVALGHLHVPQTVGDNPLIRYSGSPIPIGFGEANQEKSFCALTANGREITPELVAIPRWQELLSLKGDFAEISAKLTELVAAKAKIWLEITYTGTALLPDLHERLAAIVAGSDVVLLRVKNSRVFDRYLRSSAPNERLESLSVEDVFERCLDEHQVDDTERPLLLATYREALRALSERDARAE